MTPTQTLDWLADLIRDSGHPDINTVTTTPGGAVRTECHDGSKNFAKIAHIQPRGATNPNTPTWPVSS